MKIKITILAIITAVIIGLFMQQTVQGEVIVHNYAGKKLMLQYWAILIRLVTVLMAMNMVLVNAIATAITGRRYIKDG